MNQNLAKAVTLSLATLVACSASATNGDNLIGIGPISRAMGGTGIASPQDGISAVFANPAAMCFTPGCDYAEVDFAGTLFAPKPAADVSVPWGSVSQDSRETVYAIPAIGLSLPIDKDTRRWRFGLSAYGVTGLGVDYRGTDLESLMGTLPAPPFPPDVSGLPGVYTSLQIMKFAPSISWQVAPNFSVGGALHIDYATLDLGYGSSPGYGIGGQIGLIWKPVDGLSLGVNYVTPQTTDFRNVMNVAPLKTAPPVWRDLTLESPQTVGLGAAYSMMEERLLFAVEGRWLNWGGAEGYKDFGWEDQWVAAAGVQFAVIRKKLFLRGGYNYGSNPVTANEGFTDPGPTDPGVTVQGTTFPTFAYESFRIIGFPALVEHHVTVGLGYAFSEKFEVNVAYMHAFENSISESSASGAFTYESSLSEDSLELGLTWRF